MLMFCSLETKIYAIKNAWVRHTYVCQNLMADMGVHAEG